MLQDQENCLCSLRKKQILHKTRARDARPYGYDGIIRGCSFHNVVGARIARLLSEFVQNFGFVHLLEKRKEYLKLNNPMKKYIDKEMAERYNTAIPNDK